MSIIKSGWFENGKRANFMKDDATFKIFYVKDIFLDHQT